METKEIKLTEEELKQLSNLQTEYSRIIVELGQCEVVINSLNKQLEEVNSTRKTPLLIQLEELETQERFIGKELHEKYGDGSIDVTKGIIIPN